MVGFGSRPIPGGGGLKLVPGPPYTILGAGALIWEGVAEEDPATDGKRQQKKHSNWFNSQTSN